MNQSHRLIWSAVRGAWIIVSELAKSHAKSGVAMLIIATTTLAMPAQAVLIETGDITVTDPNVGHLASNGVTLEFKAGGIFGVTSNSFAVLKANGTGSMLDLGGGIYNLTTGAGELTAIESQGNGGNGVIDLSQASKVTLTTGHRIGLQAYEGGNLQLSDLDLTHTYTGTEAASILSQNSGSKITITKAKVTENSNSSSSGAGIKSWNGGEITIKELSYTSTNTNPALLITGTGQSKMSIGSLTGAQSRVRNVSGNLITMDADGGTLTLNNIDIAGNATGVTKLVNLSTNSVTTANNATIKNTGTGSAIGLDSATLNLTDSSVESAGIGLALGVDATATLHNSTITTTGDGKAAVMHSGQRILLNLSGNNNFVALAQDAKGFAIKEGRIFISDGANTTLSTSNGTALLLEGVTLLSDEASTANYTINTGNGEVAAVHFKTAAVELGVLNQEMTVNTGQKQGVLVEGFSTAAIGRLNVTQNHASIDGHAIQLKNNSELTIKQLTLNSNQTGLDVNFSTLTVGDSSTSSSIKVTGDNHAGAIAKDFSMLSLTRTNIETNGSGSDGINLGDSTESGTAGLFTDVGVITSGPNSVGIKIGHGAVTFAGTNHITTAGHDSTGLLLTAGATVSGLFSGSITTTGTNAVGILSDAANLEVNNTTVTTSGVGSTGINLTGQHATLKDISVNTTGTDNAVGVKVSSTSAVIFAGTNNISTAGSNSTGVLLETGAVATTGILTGSINTTGANATGIQSGAKNLTVTNTTVTTSGLGSTGINLIDGSTSLSGNTVITSANDAIGINVGTKDMVIFAGNNDISTIGSNSTALLLEAGATSFSNFTGTIVTKGENAVGIQSAATELSIANSAVTTAGIDSTGILLKAGHTTLENITVQTTGSNNAVGIKIDSASKAHFAGTKTISTTGANSTGLLLESGAILSGSVFGTIATSGDSAVGILSGATNLRINNLSVTTLGTGSTGVYLTDGTTLLSGTNTVDTRSNNAVGIKVGSTSAVDFAGINNVTTIGDHSTVLLLENGATVTGTLEKSSLTSIGDFAVGIISGAANLAVANSRVSTSGINSSGFNLTAGSASLLNTTFETSGVGSTGINLTEGNAILTDDLVLTYANDAVGLKIGSNSTALLTSYTNIITEGDRSTALLLEAGATMLGAYKGTIVAKGANADAIVLTDTSVNTQTLNLTEAEVRTNNNAVLLKKGELTMTATNSLITGDIKAEVGATLDLTMLGSDVSTSILTGAILNARNVSIDPSTWNITAHSDALNLANDGSDFRFVNADGTAPNVNYTDFKTLTVTNYTGATNGTKEANVYLNTRLNGNDVTGVGSDKIVVRDGGTMNGDTTFHFANAGVTGAATYDGIKFVDAQGSAIVDKSNFKIAGGYVAAGAYGYVGRQGQYSNLADNQSLFLTNFAPKGATVDGNGFLTGGEDVMPPKSAEVALGNGTGVGGHFNVAPSDTTSTGNSHINKLNHFVCDNGSNLTGCTLPLNNPAGNKIIYTPVIDPTGNTDDITVNPTGEIIPPTPTPSPTPTPTPSPTPSPTDPVVDPIKPTPKPKRLISPDFVTYNAAADVVSLSANTLLGTYHERMGAQNTPLMQAEKSSTYNPNSWGRLIAETREVAYDNAAFNQSVQGETMGFQLGHSFWQHRNENNALGQAGVAVGYVTGSMDVFGDAMLSEQIKTGSIDADTTSLMAYYTLATDKGTYLDAVVQYSMSTADAQGPQSSVTLESTGLRGSLEVGKPVRFDSVTVEPQAQVIAYKDSFDDATDSNGYVMSQGDNKGVMLRVGARLESNSDSAFKPWFAANLNVQNGSTATGVMDKTNNIGLNSEKDAKWADMSVGMSYQTSSDFSVYGHLKQSLAIGGGTNTTTSGAIGVQKAW